MAVGLAGVVVAGCDGGGADSQRLSPLTSRLDALEQRVAAAEKNAEPIERLRNDAASLDRRMSALETSVRELAARPAASAPGTPATPPAIAPTPAAPPHTRPSSGPAAWNNPTTRIDRTQRRVELRALSDEFRSRLADLRNEPAGADNTEKTREILDWYREQRRAILRGQGRTDQPQ